MWLLSAYEISITIQLSNIIIQKFIRWLSTGSKTMRNKTILTVVVLIMLCIVNCLTGCSTQSKVIELKDYMNGSISSIQSTVKGMEDTGFKEGNSYSDGAVTAFADFDDDNVDSITIFDQCNYSLYGITFGINMEKADSLAWQFCTQRNEDTAYKKSYLMNSGLYLTVYSTNGDTVSSIELTNYNPNPDEVADSDYGNEGYPEDDAFIYDEPDEFDYVYDLNNIGFYDMMYYTDWCKLSKIHYKGGEGYVDIDPNHNGKFSFTNGYCKIYYFNADKMDYNESYRRIFRCDIVDNDSAILVPQDSGNYIKKNLQILERSVFHNDEYVYMTINDGDSKGPYIPYEFVDWTSGERTTNDSGNTVYRFNIK